VDSALDDDTDHALRTEAGATSSAQFAATAAIVGGTMLIIVFGTLDGYTNSALAVRRIEPADPGDVAISAPASTASI
jgi:hypothetical protein